MLKRILSHPLVVERPPVLVDLGASGEIHQRWKRIARFAYCLAFDADDRKMDYIVEENRKFKRFVTINRIVIDKEAEETDFYLTRSPYCSSTLIPDKSSLYQWLFNDKFEVVKKVRLKPITVEKALSDLELDYVDWFKADTQGTDLRLFKSIPESIRRNIIVAEFEPGFIDAYTGEDKLVDVLQYFENSNYWLADLKVKGSQRVPKVYSDRIQGLSRVFFAENFLKSAGWGEMMYCRSFTSAKNVSLRDYLVAAAFSISQRQYGYTLEIIIAARREFNDPIIGEIERFAMRKLSIAKWNILRAIFSIGSRRVAKIASGRKI